MIYLKINKWQLHIYIHIATNLQKKFYVIIVIFFCKYLEN